MPTLELYITLAGDIFETFCFADEWTFVPDHFAYSVEHIPSKDEALKYMTVTWQYLECLAVGKCPCHRWLQHASASRTKGSRSLWTGQSSPSASCLVVFVAYQKVIATVASGNCSSFMWKIAISAISMDCFPVESVPIRPLAVKH